MHKYTCSSLYTYVYTCTHVLVYIYMIVHVYMLHLYMIVHVCIYDCTCAHATLKITTIIMITCFSLKYTNTSAGSSLFISTTTLDSNIVLLYI